MAAHKAQGDPPNKPRCNKNGAVTRCRTHTPFCRTSMTARSASWKFRPPTDVERRTALGPVSSNAAPGVYSLTSASFSHLRKPRARDGDWLCDHEERSHTLQSFERCGFKAVPHGAFDTIVVQPTGDWLSEMGARRPGLEKIQRVVEAFFLGMRVVMLPVVKTTDFANLQTLHGKKTSSRVKNVGSVCNTNSGRDRDSDAVAVVPQSTDDVFTWWHSRTRKVLKSDLTRRMLVGVVLTTVDIYPGRPDVVAERGWLRGLAVPMDGVAVVSVARHDPGFDWSQDVPYSDSEGRACASAAGAGAGAHGATTVGTGLGLSEDEERLVLRRSLMTICHEICHLFGLYHCIHFTCLMNGVSVDMEASGHPLALCPVCLHKLYHSLGFDEMERYRTILQALRQVGMERDVVAIWYEQRLRELRGCAPPHDKRGRDPCHEIDVEDEQEREQ